jgi:hypothetical protein
MMLAYSALFLSIVSAWLVLTPRVRLPLLMEVGWFLLSAGMLAVSVSAFSHQICTGGAVLARWGCNSTGILLVMLSLVRTRKMSHP